MTIKRDIQRMLVEEERRQKLKDHIRQNPEEFEMCSWYREERRETLEETEMKIVYFPIYNLVGLVELLTRSTTLPQIFSRIAEGKEARKISCGSTGCLVGTGLFIFPEFTDSLTPIVKGN